MSGSSTRQIARPSGAYGPGGRSGPPDVRVDGFAGASLAEVARRTSAALVQAWAGFYDAVDAHDRADLGLSVHRLGAGAAARAFVAPGIDHVMFNRAVLTDPSQVEVAAAIYRQHGVRRFLLSIDADALAEASRRPAGRQLAVFHRAWDQLARGRGAPWPTVPHPCPALLRPADRSDAPEIVQIVGAGFGLPRAAARLFANVIDHAGWEVTVAERRGAVAAVGVRYAAEEASVLVAGATDPDHRRLGLQRALVAHRVRAALEGGAPLVCSETGVAVPGEPNPSWDNLALAGLVPVHRSEHLCPPWTAW